MRLFLFIFSAVLFATSLSGQCPDRDSLWKRIVYLRDSSKVLPEQQLVELLFRLSKEKKCADPFDSAHALLLQRIGWLTSVQKNFTGAVEYTRKSIDIIYTHAGKPAINPNHLVKSYNNLRIFYDSLKRSNLEAEAIDSCISVALNLKTGYEYAVPLIYARTQGLFEAGDYYRCINYAIIGENMSRASDYEVEHIFLYQIWRINSLIFLREFKEAEELLFKAIAEARKTRYTKNLGALYGSMASIAAEKKDVKMALIYSKQAIFYDEQVKNYDGCSATLTNLGFKLYFQQLQQYDIALFYFKKALSYASPFSAVNILDNIANLWIQKGRYDSAFYYFQKAFDIIKPGADEQVLLRTYRSGLLNNNVAEYVFGLVLDKADAFQFKYKRLKKEEDLSTALHIYRVADKLLNEIKSGQSAMQSKLFWRKQARRLYEQAIAAAYLQNNAADAFYFFEKSRAVLLQDQLNEFNKLSNDDILQQAQVKRKIAQLENELNTANLSSRRNIEIQNELGLNSQILDRLEKLIKRRNPLYYQSFMDTSMITLIDVKKEILKDNQSLLELFEGDSAVYSILITSSQTYFNKINKTDFDSTTKIYISYITNQSLINSRFSDYTKTANHLYRLIFRENILPAARLIISPNGYYFPFEALVTNVSNPASPVYFLNDHPVSYTYSARYLLNNFVSNLSSGSLNFMGVAPEQYPAAMNLSALPGSSQSLAHLQAYFIKSDNYIAGKASKGNFMEQFYKYKIIQLYTHAADSSSNKEPVIYFSDSSLYLSELILGKKPFTQLIVLSACETGNGTFYAGEGVFSFNRGFAALGVPSSVTNLWSIDSRATYRLTELFYEQLVKGLPLDIALQKAKLDFINSSEGDNRLPYYWAAPILVGKTDPILLDKPFSWKYPFAALVFAGIIFFGWKKIKNRNASTQLRV